MGEIQTATLLGAAVAKVVDLLRNAFDSGNRAPKWLWNGLAFGLGIVLAEVSQLNLLANANVNGWLGVVITGILLGGSSSALHEVLDLIGSTAKNQKKAAE